MSSRSCLSFSLPIKRFQCKTYSSLTKGNHSITSALAMISSIRSVRSNQVQKISISPKTSFLPVSPLRCSGYFWHSSCQSICVTMRSKSFDSLSPLTASGALPKMAKCPAGRLRERRSWMCGSMEWRMKK